jgi:putative CocE/NonD family hydrolase
MLVAVGASNYFHSSMRQNGALEQRFLIYCYRMAVTSHEADADPALKAAITRIFEEGMPDIVNQFPLIEGSTILSRFPDYEQWAMELQQNGEYTDYWKQRGYAPEEYYEEHADVPTLYLGGWYDSYARNTTDCFIKLSAMKKSPQYLLMGPWTHGGYEVPYSGDLDFGLEAHIDYKDLKLAWFDRYLKGLNSEVVDWSPVRIFTMGGGEGTEDGNHRLKHGGYWRNEQDWPLSATKSTPYYLIDGGGLSVDSPDVADEPTTSFIFDPTFPVPTIGGGISAANPIMEPGAYDQRGDPSRFFGTEDTLSLNVRDDIVTFQTPPLEEDVEVTGPIEVHLWASSSAVDTDFTAKLLDVYPPSGNFPEGLDINIADSIIRARYRNGYEQAELMTPGEAYEFVFKLYPTSNVFSKGHRIRVDISSSNWPRFDVNHNTGEPLGKDRTYETARQTIHHSADRPSHIVLPIQPA